MANGTRWIPVGPAPEDASAIGLGGGVSGRVWAIAISPNFDGKGTAAMYLGTSGGGIWRSTDFQTPAPTWTPLLDHFPGSFPLTRVRGLSNIGALAVDPNHPSVIYAGSGDPDDRGPNGYGQGMIKSSDGGATWQLLNVLANPFSPGFCRIFVDPTDGSGNTVYAAGGFGPGSPLRGIFKSVNAGASWTQIEMGIPIDVAVHDLDFTVGGNGKLTLLAGLTDAAGINPAANGIWQSTNGGASWTQMAIEPLTDLGSGKNDQQSAIGLIKIAADRTPGTPFSAFAAISNGNTLMNVFKLVNGTWVPVGANGLRAINTTSAQAIGIAPTGQVYVAGVNDSRQNGIYWSQDSGASWNSIDVGTNSIRPHTDHHAWAFFAGITFNGNDGGVYNFNPGNQSWNSLNTSSLQTILTQGIGIHPQYPNVILEGSQDNGVALRTSGQWKYVTGDDDGRCKFDPFDARFAYRTSVSEFNFFFRSDDGGNTWPDDRSVKGMPAVQNFAPFNFHPTQPGRMALVLDRVFETRTRGDDFWVQISGQLAGANGFGGAVAYGGGDTIYAAIGGRLFLTANDGGKWTEQNPGAFGGSVTTIAVDPHDFNRVFVGTDGGRIWRTGNAGGNWTDVTGDFPSALAVNALAMRSNTAATEPVLFAAATVGVWQSSGTTSNVKWTRLGSDLPDVNATDIAFNNTNKYLIAGTYGRGLFANYLHFLTNVGLGSCSLNDVVFAVARDLDGRICVNQAQFGRAFSGWFELQGGGLTEAAPSATAINQSIFVFVKGLDQRIYLNQAQFGPSRRRHGRRRGSVSAGCHSAGMACVSSVPRPRAPCRRTRHRHVWPARRPPPVAGRRPAHG